MNPSLLIVSFSHIPSDPRVLKQVELFKRRYHVTTCGLGEGPEGVDEHIALPADAQAWPADRVSLILRRYEHVYGAIPAVAAAREALRGRRFDMILANDLNTVPLAVELQPRLGVHADLHEYAPSEKETVRTWRWFVAPYQRWLCRTYFPSLASGTTVSQGIADRYSAEFGMPFGVVTNAAPFQEWSPGATGPGIRLIHSGAAQRYRRLELMIDAMKEAPEGVTLDLVLMPNELDYLEELRERGSSVPGVSFRDPVPHAEIVSDLRHYDLALVFLPPSTFNLKQSLPNKLFEAVQARLGVIVGPSPAMQTLVEQHGFGTVIDDFEPETLASAIKSLTPETVDGWKQAAHRAAAPLSAEEQVKGWESALAAMAARA
ncbi:glycosyltransferase [Arthrobacter woluwensis]|uniref:glycosyltransferase n=1 Tax=Arthrobacter woluwensis TaxID=156980 RepID=UPI0038007D35